MFRKYLAWQEMSGGLPTGLQEIQPLPFHAIDLVCSDTDVSIISFLGFPVHTYMGYMVIGVEGLR